MLLFNSTATTKLIQKEISTIKEKLQQIFMEF